MTHRRRGPGWVVAIFITVVMWLAALSAFMTLWSCDAAAPWFPGAETVPASVLTLVTAAGAKHFSTDEHILTGRPQSNLRPFHLWLASHSR